MPHEYIFSLQETNRIPSMGNKAEHLRFLAEKGFPTPVTHVCTWDAQARYVQDDVQIVEALKAELATKLDGGKK